MPRLARLDAPGILHRVMGRGIERKKNLSDLSPSQRANNLLDKPTHLLDTSKQIK